MRRPYVTPVRGGHSVEPAYFDRMYAANEDPWGFATSAYEREKYAATIAMLEGRRFGRAFEIGCSVGVLTALLAPEVDELLAVDVNPRALELARRRCAVAQNVAFEQIIVPGEFPSGRFDFVMVSEVGYYWSTSDLELAIDRIADAASGGIVELVHYLPKVDDYPLSGDQVHERFLADSRYRVLTAKRAERYRIELLAVSH
jgi:SAM-dependent methyltransferase